MADQLTTDQVAEKFKNMKLSEVITWALGHAGDFVDKQIEALGKQLEGDLPSGTKAQIRAAFDALTEAKKTASAPIRETIALAIIHVAGKEIPLQLKKPQPQGGEVPFPVRGKGKMKGGKGGKGGVRALRPDGLPYKILKFVAKHGGSAAEAVSKEFPKASNVSVTLSQLAKRGAVEGKKNPEGRGFLWTATKAGEAEVKA